MADMRQQLGKMLGDLPEIRGFRGSGVRGIYLHGSGRE